METLKVEINKADKGVSAHIPALNGFVIASSSVATLKKELLSSVQFHIEGLYPEERESWMDGYFEFLLIPQHLPNR